MGVPQRGSKKKKQNKMGKTSHIVRKDNGGRPKDHDQVHENLKVENRDKFKPECLPIDEDKPGLGKFYCISCDSYAIIFLLLGIRRVLEIDIQQKRGKLKFQIPNCKFRCDHTAGLFTLAPGTS